jgi:hypothetical protein
VKNLCFSVSQDLQVIDIELSVTWHEWDQQEKVESLRTTVYCVNSKLKN